MDDTVVSLTKPDLLVPLRPAPLTAGEVRRKLLGVPDDAVVEVLVMQRRELPWIECLIARVEVYRQLTSSGRDTVFPRLVVRDASEFGEG